MSVSEWENKVINLKSDKKDQWKVDPEKSGPYAWYKFSWDVELPLITDIKFLYLLSDLLLKSFIVTLAV